MQNPFGDATTDKFSLGKVYCQHQLNFDFEVAAVNVICVETSVLLLLAVLGLS